MRKKLIPGFGTSTGLSSPGSWFDLPTVATVELSSEDPEHPFEQALRTDINGGWRAGEPGPQLIRIRFDLPQFVRRVHLHFLEEIIERSQEIALFATSSGSARRELVRQQWVFSPKGANAETEDYFFDLKDVETLELEVDPGRHDKQVFASLHSLQIA